MSKTFKSAALLIAVFALASCQKEFIQNQEAAENGRTFTATIAQTKAVSSTGVQTFKAGEIIDVWNTTTHEVTNVAIKAENISADGKKVDFQVPGLDPKAAVLAVYPGGGYTKKNSWPDTDDAPHFACLNNKRDGFASAVCKAGESTLTFTNVASCLAFACSGTAAKFAYLYGNNGEKFASQLFIDPETGKASAYTKGTTDYAFTNLTTGYESDIRFWVLPGIEFTKGCTVKFGSKVTDITAEYPSSVAFTVGENEFNWLGVTPLTYGDRTYKCKKFGDKIWTTENLTYVPEGATIGTPTDEEAPSMFYPYSTDGTNTTALKDDAAIRKFGYLYPAVTVFGEEITAENVHNFEGKQGICPAGWHVPTRAEFLALCGNSNKNDAGETETIIDENALFFDSAMKSGSIENFNDGGWNFAFSGCVTNNAYNKTMITTEKTKNDSWVGSNAMNYYWSSTGYMGSSTTSKPQFFALMSTFNTATQGKASLSYCNATNACPVRCVKD